MNECTLISLFHFAQVEVDEEDGEDDAYVIHSDDDDDEQFACTICRKPFRNAIETLYVHHPLFQLM